MAQVQEIKVINVDDVAYEVDKLPKEIQDQVIQYNEWRQEHEDNRIKTVKVEYALQVLGQHILTAIRAEQEKAAAETTEGTDTPAV